MMIDIKFNNIIIIIVWNIYTYFIYKYITLLYFKYIIKNIIYNINYHMKFIDIYIYIFI